MKNELTCKEIKVLFNKHLDWDNKMIASKSLESNTGQKSIELIIDKLNSNEPSIRYIASQMIIEFKIEKAKQKLIERIKAKETLNSNGSMTYALSQLDCQNNLVDIFEILATQSYESKMHAYNILSEQEFNFTKNDIFEMKQIMKYVEESKKENQIFDNETFEMIKDGFEGFNEYLKEEK
jgi:HEAT repeat protein